MIIPQMGLVELINLQAGEIGQLVLHKTFGWVFLLTPQKETNLSDKHFLFSPDCLHFKYNFCSCVC